MLLAFELAPSMTRRRKAASSLAPLGGAAKMFTWSPGWSIDDAFRVAMPAYSRAGEGMISVAWERLGGGLVPTDDGRERVDVAPIMLLVFALAFDQGIGGQGG